jgi:hypothetical protein
MRRAAGPADTQGEKPFWFLFFKEPLSFLPQEGTRGPMKIGVLFNCLNEGLAVALRALLPGAEIVNFHSAMALPPDVEASRQAVLAGCDHVVTAHFGPAHGRLSTSALARVVRNLHVVPGFAFAGFHPDMCYVHANGQVVPGVTGGYQSRIAVAAYLAGMSPGETAALYNKLVFSRLGYFAAYAEQSALLAERWARHGVDAWPFLRRWREAGCFAHTINHPKMLVVLDIARIACARMGLATAQPEPDAAALPDNLARGPLHPVFPDIAAAIGVAAELEPVDFISRSFGCFDAVGRRDLHATDGVPAAMAALGLPPCREAAPRAQVAPGSR